MSVRDICNAKAPMHAPCDKHKSGDRVESKTSAGFLIPTAVVAFVLIALTALHPRASAWISQAVEAEFVGDDGVTDTPTRIVKPDMAVPVRTVRAY